MLCLDSKKSPQRSSAGGFLFLDYTSWPCHVLTMRILKTLLVAVLLAASSARASTNSLGQTLGTNAAGQIVPVSSSPDLQLSATNLSGLLGLPLGVQGVFSSIQSALKDTVPFITNDALHVDMGALYNRHATFGRFGAFADAVIPGAIAAQTSVGFGGAYLDRQWLEANVNIQFGTTMTLPVLGSLIGPLYGWVATGPDYNLKTRSIGAYNFVGVLWHKPLPALPLLGKNWNLLISGGAGDFSTIPGTTYEGSVGLAKNL